MVGGRILNGVKLWFTLNNFSLLWPIDTKLAIWVAYIKTQLGIATQVSVIKVKVTVTSPRPPQGQILDPPLISYACPLIVPFWVLDVEKQ